MQELQSPCRQQHSRCSTKMRALVADWQACRVCEFCTAAFFAVLYHCCRHCFYRCCAQNPGYCQISCGRCNCCPTLTEAALQAGLTEFVWAMNRSVSNVESLGQPGLMATVMAPDDNAMRTLFDKLGG